MITVNVDRTVCQGYGNCVLAAEAVFDLDDDGLVSLRTAEVGDEHLDAVRRAAYDCPTEAISIVENA
jgi:ferredoxin